MDKLSYTCTAILAVLAVILCSLGTSCGEDPHLTQQQLDSLMSNQPKRLSDTVETNYISTEEGLREHKIKWCFREKEITLVHSSGTRIFRVLHRNDKEYYVTTVDIFNGLVVNLTILRKENWVSIGLLKYYINFDPPISEEPRIVVSQARTHLVRKGDNYTKLASKYGVSADTLKARNNNKQLKIGQTIRIDE